jgi:hypothetical protein
VAQKYIQTYDDSVLKLSIKQGEEQDRFPTSLSDLTSTDYNVTSALPGSFTMGELAFTRDTARVFVGNFTTNETFLYKNPSADIKDLKIQQTLGGTLVGNKYLGYIDSKPPYNNEENDYSPLSLTEDSRFTINGNEHIEKAVLKDGSSFRSYEFNALGSNECKNTEDGKWNKQSFYNSTYDAYDGDYMYDIYRNALIIFDHNIKPSEGDSSRRRSKITALEVDKRDGESSAVYNHTLDMYGDGYVCLYNIVPDGDTITFAPKNFSRTTGIADNGNYTQNIIKVQKVHANAMVGALDNTSFSISTRGGSQAASEVITLNTTQKFSEITLPENESHLILPNKIGLFNNVRVDFKQFSENLNVDEDTPIYQLAFTRNTGKNGYEYLNANFIKKENAATYTIKLGKGLSSDNGKDYITLAPNGSIPKIIISGSSSAGNTALSNEPFSLLTTEPGAFFTGNLIVGLNGSITGENGYPDNYSTTIKNITKHYDNENSKLNYLVESTPLTANTEGSKTNVNLKFKVSPVVYCTEKSDSDINAIGIFSDITLKTPAFTYTDNNETVNVPSATQILTVNDLKDIWVYTKNQFISPPNNYTKYDGSQYAYITHPINGSYIEYIKSERTPENVDVLTLKDNEFIEISKSDSGFDVIIKNTSDDIIASYTNTVKLYNPLSGNLYTSIVDLYKDIYGNAEDLSSLSSVIISKYFTTDLTLNESFRLDLDNISKKAIINVPSKKLVTKIVYDTEKILVDGEEATQYIFKDAYDSSINNIIKLEYFGKKIYISDENEVTSSNYNVSYEGDELKNYILNDTGEFIIDENILLQDAFKTRIYMIKITNIDGKIKYYEFVDNNISIENKRTTTNECVDISTVTNEYSYDMFNDETYTINLIEKNTAINLEEKEFYTSNETILDNYLDAWAHYYGDEDEKYCFGGKMKANEHEKWIEQRRINVMRQFPMIPSHATSVLLECKTGSNSSLKLKHIGNGNKVAYEANPLKNETAPTITGLTLPTTLKDNNWIKDKELVNIESDSIYYVELPLSIDEFGNKHFTFKVDVSNDVLISLAAYRA